MQGGVSLDGYSDKPYSMQRVDEIELNLVRLRAAFANQTRTKEALQREFLAEQARLARLSHASIEVPRDSRLKQVLAGQGTFVNVGDNIMEVVECSKLAVVAELTEREYARVRIGTRVHFSPRGYDEVFEGVVSQKLGPEGRYIEPALSVFRVVLALPRLSLRLGTNCEIGLSGDAYFDV